MHHGHQTLSSIMTGESVAGVLNLNFPIIYKNR